MLIAGVLLIVLAVALTLEAEDAGARAREIGALGLLAIVGWSISRGARLYRAGVVASLPATLGRSAVRVRPRRLFSAVALTLALGLPLAGGAAAVAAFEVGWLLVAGVLLLGCGGLLVANAPERRSDHSRPGSSASDAGELLRRLCMRVDMRAPALVVTPGSRAVAWTEGGRIHVTKGLLGLLDRAELEAVLAHELAHLAHRDAAVMEICAAPSRILLTFAHETPRWPVRMLRNKLAFVPGGGWVFGMIVTLAALCAPPALAIGWISRLSVLGISRARELSADAAAAALTGRPSALASALMKLDRQREWAPRTDLRWAEGPAVLCIVGIGRRRLGRLLSTHPPTGVRVARLEAIQSRAR